MRLVPKLVISGMLAVMLVMSGLTYFIITESRHSMHEKIDYELEGNVRFTRAQLLSEQDHYLKATTMITRNRQLHRALYKGDSRGINQILNEYTANYSYLDYLLITDLSMEVFAASTRQADNSRLPGEQLLMTDISSHPALAKDFRAGPTQGPPVSDPFRATLGLPETTTQWFSAPITVSGKIEGYAIFAVNWEQIQKQILASAISELLAANNPIVSIVLTDSDQQVLVAEHAPAYSAQKYFQDKNLFAPSPQMMWSDGKTPFGDFSANLIVVYDESKALEPLNAITMTTVQLTILAALLMGLLFYLILRTGLLQRLQALHSGTEMIGAGELDYRISFLGKDEVGQLGNAVNRMARNLQINMTSIDLLDREIEKREAALTELQEQKFALDQHALVSVTDTAGNITFANEHFSNVSGYPVRELIGQNHRILNSGYHDSAFFQELYRTITQGKVWHGQVRNRAKDGSIYWVDSTIVPIKDSKGEIQSYISIRTDITERKLYEIALAESKTQFQLVIESTAVGIWDWQVQTGQVSFNERWAEIVGHTLEEISPTTIETWMQFAHPDDLELSGQLLEQHWNGESDSYICEARMKHKDGHWVWVLDTGRVVEWDEDGKPKRMIGTHMDITARKATEFAMQQAKDAAEAANKSKSEFLANMSHEIRTPINGVIGMTNLLLNTDLDGEQKKYAETVKRSTDSLLGIINDILDFSKIEAGKLHLESINFDLGLLIEDIAALYATQSDDKGLELICPANPVWHQWFTGDPVRIRQILSNLISNALKFTDKGEISVYYECVSSDEAHSVLRFTVTDTGIGLSDEKLKALFDRFTQADSSTTRKYGGTGLGLAICKQLVEIMHGEIGVQSQEGKGSSFWFTLRLENCENQITPEQLPSLEQEKVLVIDDNGTCRQLLTEVLSSWGARVDQAENARAAQSKLDKAISCGNPFTVALLDLEMPDINGLDLCRKLRQQANLSELRCLLMAPHQAKHRLKSLSDHGLNGFITKPLNQSQLFNALLQVSELAPESDNRPGLSSRRPERFNAEVLVVEDNATNQLVARGILEGFGLKVSIASDGQQAINALGLKSFDLVFMDCQMPIMDGYEATQRIRSGLSPALDTEIAIVAMTANAMQGDRERCLAAGMDDYISKPVDPGEVLKALRRWLPAEAIDSECQPSEAQSTEDQSGAGDTVVFDYAAVSDRLLNDPELIRSVAQGFIEDMNGQLLMLKACLENGDIDQATAQTHKIKGATANMGGKAMNKVAEQLEEAGQQGELEQLRLGLPKLEQQFTQLKAEIEEAVL